MIRLESLLWFVVGFSLPFVGLFLISFIGEAARAGGLKEFMVYFAIGFVASLVFVLLSKRRR
jgi:thiol:disulfide interchange protein